MADRITPEKRSRNMARIRGKNTQPELAVRRILRSLGVGYRLHVGSLPGRPDIVMSGRRAVIEVRGCFWHRHLGCKFAYTPRSRQDFWGGKFEANVARDTRNDAALAADGWRLLVVWECETSDATVLRDRLVRFLGVGGEAGSVEGRSV